MLGATGWLYRNKKTSSLKLGKGAGVGQTTILSTLPRTKCCLINTGNRLMVTASALITHVRGNEPTMEQLWNNYRTTMEQPMEQLRTTQYLLGFSEAVMLFIKKEK